jgi:hypothetical protein
MNPPELPPVLPAADRRGKGYAAPLINALASVALIRIGFLPFLFLVPLGYIAAAYHVQTARRAVAGAVVLNILLSLGLSLFFKSPLSGQLLLVLYYTVMVLVFFWIMSPPEKGPAILRIRTAYRLIGGALAGALMFFFTGYVLSGGAGFSPLFRSQAELFSSFFIASSGADAVRRSYLEQYLTPDLVLEFMEKVILRGGAVASGLFLLFISRQIALSLAWIIRRVRPSGRASGSLRGFHAPAASIWILSLSLAAIPGSRILGAALVETAAWNVFVICVLLFLAQGGGIALYMIGRRAMPPMMRFFLNMLVILLVFSPGINAFALGALVLLGIAENWVPFRVPKPDGTSSTPGM